MRYLILGAGVSGLGATGLCLNLGHEVVLYDKDKTKLNELKEAKLLDDKVAICSKIFKDLVRSTDCIVLSPSIKTYSNLNKFRKLKNIDVVGELEFGARNSKGTQIAITGTNGKTTTTELCDYCLNYANKTSYAVGNVGTSICEVAPKTKDDDFLVIEASSFQLENAKTFHPHIACFLNFAPDHLDRYKNVGDYLKAKLHIFDNLTEQDFAVLNYDDEVVAKVQTLARKIFVSAKQDLSSLEYSAWFFENTIYVKILDDVYKIPVLNTELKGIHNIYNMLFASVVCILCGVDKDAISLAFSCFELPKHRCELVAKIRGVSFVDDSKATNIHATKNALLSFSEPVILLLGGSDKGEDFSSFFVELSCNVKEIITFGCVGKKLFNLAKKSCRNVSYCKRFDEAVEKAKLDAIFGDVVLLSPACASFDEFSSYAQRGECFKNLVLGGNFEQNS